MGIFKTYDVRGIYGENLTELDAYKIGYYLIKYFNLKELKLAHDCRNSSEVLVKAFINGVVDSGAKIIFLGLSSTPNFYFSLFEGLNSGVMVTASHNPKEYNGFKFIINGNSFDARNGLLEFGDLVEEDKENIKNLFDLNQDSILNLSLGDFLHKFGIETKSTLQKYASFLKEQIYDKLFSFEDLKILSNLRIGIDFSSGVSSLVFKELKESLNLNTTFFNEDCDGNFPNHPPDPNTAKDYLKKQKENFDLIFAFDGDGDRIAIYNEDKELIMVDYIIASFIDYFSNSAKNFVCDLRVSKIIDTISKEKNLNTTFIRVGRAFYKDFMDKNNCRYGAELSGHMFFNEFKNFDNPDIALFYLLKIYISELEKNTNIKFHQIFDKYKKYYKIPETNFKVKSAEELLNKLKTDFSKDLKSELDGLSFDFGDWWFNIRKSNTEPVVRINLEAKTKAIAETKMEYLKREYINL